MIVYRLGYKGVRGSAFGSITHLKRNYTLFHDDACFDGFHCFVFTTKAAAPTSAVSNSLVTSGDKCIGYMDAESIHISGNEETIKRAIEYNRTGK